MKKHLPGEAALPEAGKASVFRLPAVTGLDLRQSAGPAALTEARHIDPRRYPVITSYSGGRAVRRGLPGKMLSLHVIEGSVYVVYAEGGAVYLFRRRPDGSERTALLGTALPDRPRTISPFNLYSDPGDPLSGSYRHMAVIYPDGLWFEPGAEEMVFESLAQAEKPLPDIDFACVHLSRVFGAKGDRLYACAFNDPRDYDLDTPADISGENAWASTVQSNTKGSGDFTALCVYDGHVLAFKKHFCHILNNNKNPFRVADLLTVGTPDGKSVAETDGKLFFVAEDGVFRYNGSTVTRIDEPLGGAILDGAVATAANGMYYLYLPSVGHILVYAEKSGAWAELTTFNRSDILSMAADGRTCWVLEENGTLSQIKHTDQRAAFSFTFTPQIGEELSRLCRVSLLVSGWGLSDFTVSYTDTRKRKRTVLYADYVYDRMRLRSRVFSPSDYGGVIEVSGVGNMTLHDMQIESVT